MSVTREQIEEIRDAVADLRDETGGYFSEDEVLHGHLQSAIDALELAAEATERDFIVTFYRVVECQVTVRANNADDAVQKVEDEEFDYFDVDVTDDCIENNPSGHYPSAEEA